MFLDPKFKYLWLRSQQLKKESHKTLETRLLPLFRRITVLVCISVLVLFVSSILVVLFNVQEESPNLDPVVDPVLVVRAKLIAEILSFDHSEGLVKQRSRAAPTALKSNKRTSRKPVNVNDIRPFISNNYTVVSVAEVMQIESLSKDETQTKRNVRTDDIDWLKAPSAIDNVIHQAEAFSRTTIYGWLQLAQPMSESDIEQELFHLDASVVGSSGALVRVRLPSNRNQLETIRELSWIQGIGVQPAAEKVSPALSQDLLTEEVGTEHPVFITVVSDEEISNYRQELEKYGVRLGKFFPDIRVFAAVIKPENVYELAQIDFIQAIEPIRIVRALHDTAVQSMGVDSIRKLGSAIGSYTGINGQSVPIGVIDTGLNTNHISISSFRKSVCGQNMVPKEDEDLWIDDGLHGTHVTGTIASNGYYQPVLAGMAPGVQHIRFAKALSRDGLGSNLWLMSGIDFLTEASSCGSERWTNDEVRPLIVNLSLGATGKFYDGKGAWARKIDSAVWSYRQLYVCAGSNSDIAGFGNTAAGKNTLGVGASYDNGDLVQFSSRGPTYDGRLLIDVVGTGVDVYSPRGAGSYDAYRRLSGTSMASPSVAGVATLLMDASPEYQEKPALVRARLMASTIKPDRWLEMSEHFPRNNTNGPGSLQAAYGLGFVSARTSILNDDVPEGWISSAATIDILNQDDVAYYDIEVPQGASRLDVVLTWDEPSAETIASTVLNDLDLWIDQGADCGAGACGEHSSESTIDNNEWVLINDPEPGTYRLKVHGARIFTDVRPAVAWTVIRGPSTPQLIINVDQDSFEVEDGEGHRHTVALTVNTSGYVALGTELYIDCRTQAGLPCESFGRSGDSQRSYFGTVEREDGTILELTDTGIFHLGEVAFGEEQKVELHLFTKTRENLVVNFTASSWNADSGSTSVKFLVKNSDSAELELPTPPTNDAFATPTLLPGAEGSMEIDTLLASTEGGESGLKIGSRRDLRTLWYSWKSESADLASVIVTPRTDSPSWYLKAFAPKIDVFVVNEDGVGFGAIDWLAYSPWSAQWFAKPGKEYRVRITGSHGSLPLQLRWAVGKRAPNDNFAAAIVLNGESGTTDGHNIGATLEEGETYGHLTASVWFRWVAPEDGRWQFQVKDAQNVLLLIFTGNDVGNLRLVSGLYPPGEAVPLTVERDKTYYLMVASPDVVTGGWEFEELTWSPSDINEDDVDFFERALSLSSVETGSSWINANQSFSVEPGEVEENGIQTAWVRWKAPTDGQYTWYWNGEGQTVNLYQGRTLRSLEPLSLDRNSFTSSYELVVDLRQDEEYYLSVGLPQKSYKAFRFDDSRRFGHGTSLDWGLTPANNTMKSAETLSELEGTTNGSVRFATTEPDGLNKYGRGSIWYAYEAPATGWYKFWIANGGSDYRLAAFQLDSGSAERVLLGSSLPASRLGEGVTIIVYVVEGEEIYVRVGHKDPHPYSQFTLAWEPTATPQWLKYLGRIATGYRDANNHFYSIDSPRDLAFDSTGTSLFVSTKTGVQILERDPDSGDLSYVQLLSEVPYKAYLVWDPFRDRMYAYKNQNWWAFKPITGENSLELTLDYTFDDGTFSWSEKYGGDPVLFIGGDGNYLYQSNSYELRIYEFDESGRLEIIGDADPKPRHLSPYLNGAHWLRTEITSVEILRREIGSGRFRTVSEKQHHSYGYNVIAPIAVDQKTFFLSKAWVFYSSPISGFSVNLELSDLDSMLDSSINLGLVIGDCMSVVPRPEVTVIDVVCANGAYVVEYDEDTGEISLRDFMMTNSWHDFSDRFGRSVPQNYEVPLDVPVAESPDRKHLYVSTKAHGILIFERIGIRPVEVPVADWVKRLDWLQISDNKIEFGKESVEDGCLTVSNVTIDNVNYTIEDSKWQHRDVGADWEDIAGSSESNRVCSRSLEETKEYRVVATVSVDDTSSEYASNFIGQVFYSRLDELDVTSSQIDLDALTITDCTEVSEMVLNNTKYTVETSQWQVRDNAEDDWQDIEDTKTTRELCPYTPNDDREYRLVGAFLIDDERDYYHSNTITDDD